MTLDRTGGRNPNLGFGHVPPKQKTLARYTDASRHVISLLSGGAPNEKTLDAISEVKGLCNRILREDQSDWVVVWLWMGLPSRVRLKWMADDLPDFRSAFKEDDLAEQSNIAERLQRAGLLTALTYFIHEDEPPEEEGWGYLYLLSTRSDRDLLKIGQTGRDVLKRVEEINRATGVVEPLSARRVWRVRNPSDCEKAVHSLLASYRVRSDREFFCLPMSKAAGIIETHLRSSDSKMRIRGHVKRVFSERKFGFIETDGIDYFFHASEVRNPSFEELAVGDEVSFDRLDTTLGLAAADIQKSKTGSAN